MMYCKIFIRYIAVLFHFKGTKWESLKVKLETQIELAQEQQ